MPRPTTVAIVLAAGSGKRAGEAKQFRRAGGRSLLAHACAPFVECGEVGGLIVVAPASQVAAARRSVQKVAGDKLLAVIAGGKTRSDSSRAGLAQLPSACRTVLIHDAARPFADVALIRRVARAARKYKAVIPAVRGADSLVQVDDSGTLKKYLSRDHVLKVQTPQGFDREVIEAAFARRRRRDDTDDASVVRAAGHDVHVVAGSLDNVKVTTGEELAGAARRLSRRR